MTRIHHVFLSAAVILLMIAAGCTSQSSSGAPPLITATESPAATPVPTATTVAGTTQPGAAATQAPGTCSADVSSDPANCGGCGYACPANALCQQSQCFCKDGYTVENNACVVATSGTSSGNGCPSGMSPCPDGYCYELASSAANCGACGNACPAGMICSASTCASMPAETTAVPATTTATGTTTTTTITPVTTVTGVHLVTPGGYMLSCVALGKTSCSGTCVNLSTNNGNCGSCGHICSGLTATCCDGTCTNLNTDASNCGSCGHKCSFTTTCVSGSCKVKSGVTVVVTPKISLKITPIYQQPGPVFPGI